MHENKIPIVIPPRFMPRDFLDVLLGLPIGMLQAVILFGLPAWITYVVTYSFDLAFLAFCVAYGFFLLFMVRRLTVTADGLRFHRILGSPKTLLWEHILSIEPVSRSELILRGWLWPIFPSREMTPSLSCIKHYRITWDAGFFYYPPADIQLFEECLIAKLQNQNIRQSVPSSYSRKCHLAIMSYIAAIVAAIGIGRVLLSIVASDLIVAGCIQESRIGEPSDRIDVYVPDGHRDQYYFVNLDKISVLKGTYPSNTIGICLHSPAMSLGIREEHPQGHGYILLLKRAMAPDGRKSFRLIGHQRIYP